MQVTNKAHLSEGGYQHIEAGKRIPNVYLVVEMASTLKCPLEELFPLSSIY
ncbi:MAG: helix-turn-helix transcriptional regulator [Lachnospiraceae bacterium]|nr:helix-turn-helix transcriptional regulator [Lachnospiraceae bacterium]